MRKIISILIILLPLISYSQTRIKISGFSEYDAWTHMDPFYIVEPNPDTDNMRPVEYEERNTHIKLGLDSQLMAYWIGVIGVKIDFRKLWGNRKHLNDGDVYFASTYPITPYQTKRDYIKYDLAFYYGGRNNQTIKPYLGFGGEFKIEETTSTFIYIDNQINASADPYVSIPVDEHVERRFNYYGVAGVDVMLRRHFYVSTQLRLYFDEFQIDEKHLIRDRTVETQWRPMIELGFVF